MKKLTNKALIHVSGAGVSQDFIKSFNPQKDAQNTTASKNTLNKNDQFQEQTILEREKHLNHLASLRIYMLQF